MPTWEPSGLQITRFTDAVYSFSKDAYHKDMKTSIILILWLDLRTIKKFCTNKEWEKNKKNKRITPAKPLNTQKDPKF